MKTPFGNFYHRLSNRCRFWRASIILMTLLVLAAIALLSVSVALSTQMRTQWQLTLLWGILVGSGTGVTALVLAAVAYRS